MISVPCRNAIFAAFGRCSWELLNNITLSLARVKQGPIYMQVHIGPVTPMQCPDRPTGVGQKFLKNPNSLQL